MFFYFWGSPDCSKKDHDAKVSLSPSTLFYACLQVYSKSSPVHLISIMHFMKIFR